MFEGIISAILHSGGYLGGLIQAATHHPFVSGAATCLLLLISAGALGAGGYLVYRASRARPSLATLKDKKKKPEEIATLRRVWGPAAGALGGVGLIFAGVVFVLGLSVGLSGDRLEAPWATSVDTLVTEIWALNVALNKHSGSYIRGLYNEVAPLIGVTQSAQPRFSTHSSIATGTSAASSIPTGGLAVCAGAGCLLGYAILLVYIIRRVRTWSAKVTEVWSPLHLAGNRVLMAYVVVNLVSVVVYAFAPEAVSSPAWPSV